VVKVTVTRDRSEDVTVLEYLTHSVYCCNILLDLFWHGALDPEGRCAQETLCLVNPESPQCMTMEITKNGTTTHSVNENGDVFQCDSTNEDGDCSFLEYNSCYSSSLFPSCQFYTTKSSVVLAEPNIISNSDPQGLEDQSYMIFYSDDACSEWAGLKGVTSGEQTFPVKTDESVSCLDALACAFHPEGDKCKSLTTVAEPTRMLTMVGDDGVTQMCGDLEDPSTCEPVDASACVQSELLPSCYYRMASAGNFLSDPASFVVSSSAGGEAEASSTSDNGSDEAIPPEEGGDAPSEAAASGAQTSRVTGFGLLVVTVMATSFMI